MKTSTIYISLILALNILIGNNATAQQSEIEYNSDTGTSGPQLLIQESGDAGNTTGQDGWARIWFKNTDDPINRWGFLARPQAGATDNPDSLMSPLVMAYTGIQKFGFGKDGTLRINKKYSLPNVDGSNGQVLTTDGVGNVSWADGSGSTSPWTEIGSTIRFTNSGLTVVDVNSTNANSGFGFMENGTRESLIWHEASSGDLNFSATNSASTRNMVIDGNSQYVGIGINNIAPTEMLDVKVTGNDGIRIEGNDTGDARLSIFNGDGTHYIFDDDSDDHDLKIESANDFVISVGGPNEILRIDGDSERVAIGELGPFQSIKFEVYSNSEFKAIEGQYSGDSSGIGVSGLCVNSSPSQGIKTGVRGLSIGDGSGDKYGVEGIAIGTNATHKKYGVIGVSSPTDPDSWALYGAGDIYYTGSFQAPSDKRLKKNIQPMESVINKVMDLETRTYEFKTEENPHMNLATGPQVGFISQQVQELFPDLVESNNHSFRTNVEDIDAEPIQQEVEILSLNTLGMVPILTKAIQEQQIQIEDQQSCIDSYESRIADIETENVKLKNQIAAIIERLDTEGK